MEAFYSVVRADFFPVLFCEVHVRQVFAMPSKSLSAALFNFILRSFSATRFAFSKAAALSSCAWMAFSMRSTSLPCLRGTTERYSGRNRHCLSGTSLLEIPLSLNHTWLGSR